MRLEADADAGAQAQAEGGGGGAAADGEDALILPWYQTLTKTNQDHLLKRDRESLHNKIVPAGATLLNYQARVKEGQDKARARVANHRTNKHRNTVPAGVAGAVEMAEGEVEGVGGGGTGRMRRTRRIKDNHYWLSLIHI